MTPQEFANGMNHLTREQIAQAMEGLPTDALEWGVRFEALSHRSDPADLPGSQEATPCLK
jgi:hypothetical protein